MQLLRAILVPALLWLIAVAGAPALYWLAVQYCPLDHASSWIEYHTRGMISYGFVAAWLIPIGAWFALFAGICLLRSCRARWWQHALLAAWSLSWGPCVCILSQIAPGIDRAFHNAGLTLPSGDPLLARVDAHIAIGLSLSAFISIAILAIATRSRAVAIATILAAPLAPLGAYVSYPVAFPAAAWFAIVLGALFWWAEAARRQVNPGVCPCGYDLRAIPRSHGGTITCPECGRTSAALLAPNNKAHEGQP